MLDLIVRNARIANGDAADIGCRDGRIAAIGDGLTAQAAREIDVGGRLVSPPFVDCHFHMDATLSLGRPRLNLSGTLLEGIELWGELRAIQSADEIIGRAMRYCDLAVAQGILAIRSHVDVTDARLIGVEALLEVKRLVAPYIDLQLVAFPQDGLYRSSGAEANLLRALDLGVEVVGGIPHFERTMDEGATSVRRLCAIAAERGLRLDLHCDESDDPMSRHVETLAAEVMRLGIGGRATASHLTSMHSMDNYYVSKLIPLIAESGMNVVANPPINILLSGRHDAYPKRRGMTRVAELEAAGINVAFGQDCMMDPWHPLGNADMLEVASIGLHVGQLSSRAAMAGCFEAVTTNAAAVMGLADYGLRPGACADMVVLDAADPVEAIRQRATRLFVIRAGSVIAETPARVTKLALAGRPPELRHG